jgi:hypothetical protein
MYVYVHLNHINFVSQIFSLLVLEMSTGFSILHYSDCFHLKVFGSEPVSIAVWLLSFELMALKILHQTTAFAT